MSTQITTAFVNQYRANVEHLLQQKGSKLRPFVRVESQNSEFEYYDRIGSVDAVEVTSRHSDTPLISTPHDRRQISLRDFIILTTSNKFLFIPMWKPIFPNKSQFLLASR